MLQLVSALQILLHLPLIKVNTPALTTSIIEVVLPVAMFDILDLLQDTQVWKIIMYIFLDDSDKLSQQAYEKKWSQSINIGYKNYNAIQNLSSVSYLLFFLYVKSFICTVLFIRYHCYGKNEKQYKILKKLTSMNEFFVVFMETYLEIILACYFNIVYGNVNDFQNSLERCKE